MDVVIVGGGAAGASAAARAKRLRPEANVVLVEATEMITHAPCAIPYYVEGVVGSASKLAMYSAEDFEKSRGVRVLTNAKALDIDLDKRTILIAKSNGKRETVKWDKLVLATGALPKPPPVPGLDLGGVFTIRHPAGAVKLREELHKASAVAIVGASYLGIEMAEALLALGKKVLIVERSKQVMPSLDSEIAGLVAKELVARGAELHLSEELVELRGQGRVRELVTSAGSYNVDAVILATGIKPNTGLAERAGIKLGVTGAVEVNEYMETSAENVYAAGDVAEKVHRVTGRRVWIPLAPTANKEGHVAGTNAVLGRALRFSGVLGTAITKFFNLYVGKTGLTERETRELGLNYRATTISAKTKAHYYPGSSEVTIKLVIEGSTGRILGAQIAGYDDAVAAYLDALAIAIDRRMTVEELFFADLGYMPAVAPVWHPLITVARVLMRELL